MDKLELLCSKGPLINRHYITKKDVKLSGVNVKLNPEDTACNLTCSSLIYLLSKVDQVGRQISKVGEKVIVSLVISDLVLQPLKPKQLPFEKLERWIRKYRLLKFGLCTHLISHEFIIMFFEEKFVLLNSFIGKYSLKYKILEKEQFQTLFRDLHSIVSENTVKGLVTQYFPIEEHLTKNARVEITYQRDVSEEKINSFLKFVELL